MKTSIQLPQIQYSAPLHSLDFTLNKSSVKAQHPPLFLRISTQIFEKINKLKKGFVSCKLFRDELISQSAMQFSYFDQLTTKQIIASHKMYPLKIVDSAARMTNQLMALYKGFGMGSDLQSIKMNHSRTFILSHQLFHFYPNFHFESKEISMLKFAGDQYYHKVKSGDSQDIGLLLIDPKKRLLLRKFQVFKETSVGVWIRRGNQNDIWHILLQFILSTNIKKLHVIKDHFLLLNIATSKLYAVKINKSQWCYSTYHIKQYLNSQCQLQPNPNPNFSFFYQFEQEAKASKIFDQRQQVSLKNSLQMRSSLEVKSNDRMVENLCTIIKNQNDIIRQLQSQVECLQQIVIYNATQNFQQNQINLANISFNKFSSSKHQSQPQIKMTRYLSFKQPTPERQSRIMQSNLQMKSNKSLNFKQPFRSEIANRQSKVTLPQEKPHFQMRLQYDGTTDNKKRQFHPEFVNLRQTLLSEQLDPPIEQFIAHRSLKKQKIEDSQLRSKKHQFITNQLNQSFQYKLPQLSKDKPNQIQIKVSSVLKQLKQKTPQKKDILKPESPCLQRIVYFQKPDNPSVQSVQSNFSLGNNISLGFLQSFNKERNIQWQRQKLDDSDSQDPQFYKIESRYNRLK